MTENPTKMIARMAHTARAMLPALANSDIGQRCSALYAAGTYIGRSKDSILAANAIDMAAAKQKGLSSAMLDRLALNDARIDGIVKSLNDVAELPETIGIVQAAWQTPNGLKFERISVPMGLIGVIYESRPNVTADAAAIALKAGNGVILRGGSEALHTSREIFRHLHAALEFADLSGAVQFIDSPDRDIVGAMLQAHGLIDVIIPRGGKSLVARVQQEARVPVIAHLDGICHTYVDASATLDMARAIVLNAKMRRTGICGATETLLIDRSAPAHYASTLIADLCAAGCEVRTDAELHALNKNTLLADEADWSTEYLEAIISVKYVDGVNGAITHIARYSSQHTDAIIADDDAVAAKFLRTVDSAIVLHNASTQFADGGEFGFGAEIGISTNRLPPRGPVGVEQLSTYKYIVRGAGTIRG